MRVLLVDDDTDFRLPLKKRLQRRGFLVFEAESGEGCRSFMEHQAVDVVILDVKMPGESGLEVLGWIRSRFSQTEVILLTGQACVDEGVEGIKNGAFDYLAKPMVFEHLFQKIGQALAKVRRQEELDKETELKRRMEQQRAATEHLVSLGTLSTGIAHEIDAPLSAIRESAEGLRRLLAETAEDAMPRRADFEKAVAAIEAAVAQAGCVTRRLLAFVRQPQNMLTQTDLKALISETVKFVLREARQRQIEIIQQTDQAYGVIWSDAYAIRQVLMNLITNAMAAIESTGTITISLTDRDPWVTVSVADTGSGITPENLEKIFEPFFTTRTSGNGTGLGLYVTAGLVSRLGGKIDVSSRLGQGSLFRVTLPRSPEGEPVMDTDLDICTGILSRLDGRLLR